MDQCRRGPPISRRSDVGFCIAVTAAARCADHIASRNLIDPFMPDLIYGIGNAPTDAAQ